MSLTQPHSCAMEFMFVLAVVVVSVAAEVLALPLAFMSVPPAFAV